MTPSTEWDSVKVETLLGQNRDESCRRQKEHFVIEVKSQDHETWVSAKNLLSKAKHLENYLQRKKARTILPKR